MAPDPIALDLHLHRLHNVGGLARLLGVSRFFITAMRRAGFQMPGNKASLAMARAWLADAQDFNYSVLRKARKQPKAASSGRAHEPVSMNAPHKPSSGSPKTPLRKGA